MSKMLRTILALALTASALAAPSVSQARTDVSITVGPPPPIVETVPPPRAGYVWAPGYWNWNGHKHVWHRGYWLRERRGYAWEADRWDQRGDRWYYERGHWRRG
jgi:hypothetical protein